MKQFNSWMMLGMLAAIITMVLAPVTPVFAEGEISTAQLTPTPTAGTSTTTTPATAVVDVPPAETYFSLPLCLPGDVSSNNDCLEMGPAGMLHEMAKKGMEFPLAPLPAYSPDPAYMRTEDTYLNVTKEAIPVYQTMADAAARNHGTYLAAGRKVLAIVNRVDTAAGIYYQLKDGSWVEAGEAGAACCIYEGRFQGLIFTQTPRNSFGWIVDQAHPRTAPTYKAPETARTLARETVIQIYDRVKADGTQWYQIGVNEWVEYRYARQLRVDTTPPEGVDNNRWIDVNLFDQTLAVYDQGKLVFATLITTGGKPFYTRPGLFKIFQKKPFETMSGSFEADRSDYYYYQDVPYTMYFDEARALHGAYWRALFGYPASHGCVNLSIGDSRYLYEWAKEGDYVHVWDPSGETPTDPAYYGKGGA